MVKTLEIPEVISRKAASSIGLAHYFTGKPCLNGHVSLRGIKSKSCIDCMTAIRRRWHLNNKEKVKGQRKIWLSNNREKERARLSARYASDGAREEKRAADRVRWRQNKDQIRKLRKARAAANPVSKEASKEERKRWRAGATERSRIRREQEPLYRLKDNLRRRIRFAYSGLRKTHTTKALIGCSYEEFASHIESMFQPGMSWDNRSEWHIDHVMPISSFDIANPVEAMKAFHYTNCQPLWAIDNLRKWNKIP